MKMIVRMVRLGVMFALTLALAGCLVAVRGGGGRVVVADQPTVYTTAKAGPPAHAKARGYRSKFRYHYYPDAGIYFDTGRGVYFYLDSNGWKMSVSLPRHLQINLGEHVSIVMESRRPYLKHHDHLKKYPPKKFKHKKNKKYKHKR